jgi:magnesium chelatase family protein
MKETQTLEKLLSKQACSVRAYHRVLKVARTIADLEGSADILQRHISEAVCFKISDEKYRKGGGLL